MSVAIEEQETTISYSRTDNEVNVWTSDRTVMTKLDKYCKTSPEFYQCIDIGIERGTKNIITKTYKIKDKKLVSFRAKKNTREYTDEQRAAIKQRLHNTKKSE